MEKNNDVKSNAQDCALKSNPIQASLRSMTGFGRGSCDEPEVSITAEIKCVNSRYLEILFRGSSLQAEVEQKARLLIREVLERGRVEVKFHIQKKQSAGIEIAFNRELAERYVTTWFSFLQTQEGAAAYTRADVAMLVAQRNEVWRSSPSSDPSSEQDMELPSASLIDSIPKLATTALQVALTQLLEMRTQEGVALKNDLLARTARLSSIRAELAKDAQSFSVQYAADLKVKVNALLGDTVMVDDVRLLQEVALIAEKTDFTEELVRLTSHLSQCALLLEGPNAQYQPVGRKFEFLLQELGREFTTVGSKTKNSATTALIVEAKSELEKMREQVQNIE